MINVFGAQRLVWELVFQGATSKAADEFSIMVK